MYGAVDLTAKVSHKIRKCRRDLCFLYRSSYRQFCFAFVIDTLQLRFCVRELLHHFRCSFGACASSLSSENPLPLFGKRRWKYYYFAVASSAQLIALGFSPVLFQCDSREVFQGQVAAVVGVSGGTVCSLPTWQLGSLERLFCRLYCYLY